MKVNVQTFLMQSLPLRPLIGHSTVDNTLPELRWMFKNRQTNLSMATWQSQPLCPAWYYPTRSCQVSHSNGPTLSWCPQTGSMLTGPHAWHSVFACSIRHSTPVILHTSVRLKIIDQFQKVQRIFWTFNVKVIFSINYPLNNKLVTVEIIYFGMAWIGNQTHGDDLPFSHKIWRMNRVMDFCPTWRDSLSFIGWKTSSALFMD